ncbi:MAG: hypothetical protein O7G30_18920, partial [Proteobacteria bacterium]|nr:hypothetical protein [Pseudomonadota bacterium]
PSWDYLQYLTVRANPSLDVRYGYSLPPLNLLQLVSPYLPASRYFRAPGEPGNPNEFGVYDGAVALALVVWVLMRLRSLGPRAPMALGLLGLLLVSVDLSLGRWGFLYQFQVQLPVVGLFRASCRYILLVHLAMAGLGALAFEDLRNLLGRGAPIPARRLWPLAIPPALGLAVAAAALSPSLREVTWLSAYVAQLAAWPWILLGPALAVLAALLLFAAARGGWWALPVLIVFSAADQGFYSSLYIFEEPPVSYQELRTPPPLPPPDPMYRVHGGVTDFAEKTPNVFTLWGYRLSNGYSGWHRDRELNYNALKPLRIAGVRWIYRNYLEEPKVDFVSNPMPRVRLVTRAIQSAAPQADLRSIDIEAIALVAAPVALEPGPPGRATLVEDRPGRITVATEAETRQLLILAEKHLAGWQVRIDGEPAELVRVYGDFMGAVVEAGRNEVRFEFAPASLRVGGALTLAGLLGAGLWPALFLYATRRGAAAGLS